MTITSGISNFKLSGNSPERDLFQARFTGLIPEVRMNKGAVRIRYRLSIAEWVRHTLLWNRHEAKISLHTTILWEIDLNGGVSEMKADLQMLKLKSLAFKGGVSQADIALPHPSGTVPISILGGSNRISFSCMQRTEAQLRASGGISQLQFGDQLFSSVGERIELKTPGYEDTTDRYDIRVFSGASHLAVLRQE